MGIVKNRNFVVGFVLMLLFTGCALNGVVLTKEEKARFVGSQLMEKYTFIHQNAKDAYDTGTEEQKAYLRENVNPKLNTIKRSILAYNKAVYLWQAGLTEEPEDIYGTQLKIQDSLNEILPFILEFINKEEN